MLGAMFIFVVLLMPKGIIGLPAQLRELFGKKAKAPELAEAEEELPVTEHLATSASGTVTHRLRHRPMYDACASALSVNWNRGSRFFLLRP